MAAKQSGGWLKWVILLLLIAGAAAGGWYYKNKKPAALQYETATVSRGDLTQVVTATGTLNPVVNVTVGSQVSGIINKLNVDFNSIVKSNEIIAQIDPSTYRAALAQAQADLANAKANQELQQVEAGRSAELFTNKLISHSDYDTAIATLHEAEANVQIKQAVLDTATANLGYCDVRSPVDGIVISRSVDLGQTVASSFNTPTLFQIANDLTKMQIDSSVAEADIGGILEGQAVDFTVDAYPYNTFNGSVIQVRNSPTNANNVVTYDCVIGVTNADYKLKPGMTANISFIIAQRFNVLNIPNAALRFHPADGAVATNAPATDNSTATNSAAGHGQHHHGNRPAGERPVFHVVYVLKGSGETAKLEAVNIKTGISDGIATEVISGLDEGAQVVTSVATPDGTPGKSNSRAGGFPRMH
ncbi:MAG TPA: efflux RND transporter periplasmic adaptor subunit [Verrucomicrobiae bacterium]|jgi:HlyD family secretion protein